MILLGHTYEIIGIIYHLLVPLNLAHMMKEFEPIAEARKK